MHFDPIFSTRLPIASTTSMPTASIRVSLSSFATKRHQLPASPSDRVRRNADASATIAPPRNIWSQDGRGEDELPTQFA